MELRCPECFSPEVEQDPQGEDEVRLCGNCGARFARDSALVTVLEAEGYRGEGTATQRLFTFNPTLAAIELRKGDGAITTVNPYSDADELHYLLDGARSARIIESVRARAAIHVYPMAIADPEPLLAVDAGVGVTLLGFELKLHEQEGEDLISFTVRFLKGAVEEANGLAAGRAADSERLDRIAAFMNRPGQWNGGDVCEYVARELHASGRRLLEEE